MSTLRAVLLFVTIIVIDQVSKSWAMALVPVSFNSGISFGLAPVWGSVIHGLGLGVLLVGSLLTPLRKKYRPAICCILAAGASNMLDRLRWGSVIDWIQVPGTSLRNNLADYVVVLGVLWLIGVMMYDQYAAT